MKKIFTLLFCLQFYLSVTAAPWTGTIAVSYAGGAGTIGDPYQISTGDELAYLAQQANAATANTVGKYFKLTADIDLGVNVPWTPIGNSATCYFGGIFDGDNHSISNIYISDITTVYVGLFGYIVGTSGTNAVVKNITMASGSLTNTNASCLAAGTLAGRAVYTQFLNCKSAVNISGYTDVGGLVGVLGSSTSTCIMEYCSNSGTVSSSINYAGGLVGNSSVNNGASTYSRIYYCYNTGAVSTITYSGGIAGTNSGNLTIDQCYNKGQITASNSAGGGIVGYGYGLLTISNCYNTALVRQGANVANGYYGGVLGYPGGNEAGKFFTEITNCYSLGNVTVIGTGCIKEAIAGLLSGGGSAGGTGTVTNCHYLSTLAVTNVNGGTSQISADLIASPIVTTLNNGQSPAVWATDDLAMNGGYPILVCQRLASPTTISAAASISTTGFTAGWSTVSNASSYDVKVYDGATLISTTNASGQATVTLAITGLTANTTYSYTVTAKGNGTTTFDSYASTASASFSTLPLAPTVAAASSITSSGFTANWTAATQGASSYTYTLEYGTLSDLSSGTTLVASISSATLSSALSSLITEMIYYYRVKSVNSAGSGAWSSIQSVTTLAAAPTSAGSYASGAGTVGDPYLIATAGQLAYLAVQANAASANTLGKYYKLTADIDLGSVAWLPIGTLAQPFKGNFDGNNYSISNLYINTVTAYQGLFGYVVGTAPSPVLIQNLTMASGSVRALEDAGSIVGKAYYLNMSNCKNAVTVTGVAGTGSIGGLAGGMGSVCIVENCSNSGTISAITGAGLYIGGIVGNSLVSNTGSDYSYIRYCFNTGIITGVSNVGGIAGTNSGNLTIKECYNKAQITAGNTAAGGIVGYGYGLLNVLNCYNTALVRQSANVANGLCGGILGYPGGNEAGKYFTAVTNCYSIGNVTVTGSGSVKEAIAGALTGGGSAGGTGAVVNSHYLSTLAVTNSNGGTSQTSGNLQAAAFITTINNSQSPAVWGIDDIAMNGGYPVLLWQRLAAPTTINAAASILSSGFTASWSTVTNASSYDVKVYAGATLISTTNANGQATSSVAITGLTPSTTYTYTVITKGNASTTFDSYASTASASFTTSATAVTVNGPGTTNVSTLATNVDVTVAAGATLAINAAKTIHNLTVATGAKVDFDLVTPYTLTVTGNVVFQSDKTTSFSTNIGAGGMNVTGNVSYVKTMDNLQWYFMAFPCVVNVDNITKPNGTPFNLTTELFIKRYDGNARVTNLGATSNWIPVTAGVSLSANQGYIFGIANGIGPFDVTFPLEKSVVISEPAEDVPVTAHGSALSIDASHKGWNLVGQPYLSNYTGSGSNVALMTFFEEGYYYATYAKADVTSIAPFRAFFVQADAALALSSITFNLDQRQTVHAAVRNDLVENVKINITTATGVDHASLTIDPQRSVDYEIGHDMVKWLTTGTAKPQLYTSVDSTKFAFNALPLERVHNLPVGIYTKSAGVGVISADLSAAPGITQLILKDNVTGANTDLLTSDYSFDASAGSTDNRFSVSARTVATVNPGLSANSKLNVRVVSSCLWIENIVPKTDIQVYDLLGQMIVHESNPNSTLQLPLHQKGMYTVRLKNGNDIIVRKVVNP